MARQRLGQHFLIRETVLRRIALAACPTPAELVIEIGPGRGALTRHLLERSSRVVAVELDAALIDHLKEKFAGETRLEVVHADALEFNFSRYGPAVVAGNLPYYAASPIIQRVLELGPLLRRGVFLVQKEVAERLTADSGTRSYGYISAAVALSAIPKTLFEVKPAAFLPPPKVDSAVIRVETRDRAAELGIRDRAAFLAFLSACFRQKRKTIRNNLAGLYPKHAVDALPQAGLRAEQIGIDTLAAMYRSLAGSPGVR